METAGVCFKIIKVFLNVLNDLKTWMCIPFVFHKPLELTPGLLTLKYFSKEILQNVENEETSRLSRQHKALLPSKRWEWAISCVNKCESSALSAKLPIAHFTGIMAVSSGRGLCLPTVGVLILDAKSCPYAAHFETNPAPRVKRNI